MSCPEPRSPAGPARLEPLGDRAFLAHFEDETQASAWAAGLRRERPRGVTDVVLAYRSAGVFADPEQVDLEELETVLRGFSAGPDASPEGRLIAVPVLYDGPDLEEAAGRLKLSAAEVVREHTAVEYRVFAIGFLQGFPYAGYLPPALRGLPRRDEPRAEVPPGSVAIAGRQTGIYPCATPGGWHLLGRTPLLIADPEAGRFLIRAGDRIRFQAIDDREFRARLHERP